jgi:hypothetical protein
MAIEFSDEDEGKPVMHGDETVGRIVSVEHGTAHVDPDPNITDTVMATLGWGDTDEDTYPLQEEAVEAIGEDEVHLSESM